MLLSDGRRIVATEMNVNNENEIIPVHKRFRMIVLANRPGYPFMGNDLYRLIGDVFAVHCIDNPDAISEFNMLKKYAPDLSEDLLEKLISSFNELRNMVNEGQLNYPYSTRELVSVVKHLQVCYFFFFSFFLPVVIGFMCMTLNI